MISLVAITKALQYWQKDFSPFTSFTPSHARQTFVFSPGFTTLIWLSFPDISEWSNQRPGTRASNGFRRLPIYVSKFPRKDTKEISKSDRDQWRNSKEFCWGWLVTNNPFTRFALIRHQINKDGLIAVKFTLNAIAKDRFVWFSRSSYYTVIS